MNKKNAKQNLKSLSITYIILAVIGIIFACVVNFVPSVTDAFKQYSKEENFIINFNIEVAVSIIGYIWYFWLARRFVNGKSNGTFYMILLIIGVAGGILSLIFGYAKSVATIDFTLDLVALYFLLKAKKQK